MRSEKKQLAIDDHAKYGDKQKGVYKGIYWKAVRCYVSSPLMTKKNTPENSSIFHWCGYVVLGDAYKKEHKQCMLDAGCECTYRKGGTIGFHCNHCWDYPYNGKGLYCDFPYVLEIIQAIIDKILEL